MGAWILLALLLSFLNWLRSLCLSCLELLNSSCNVQDLWTFAGKERMAVATDFNFKILLCWSNSKSVPACAGHLSRRIIGWMCVLFHVGQYTKYPRIWQEMLLRIEQVDVLLKFGSTRGDARAITPHMFAPIGPGIILGRRATLSWCLCFIY